MTYGGYPDLKGIRKILIVKLRHLGDVLLTGPVFSSLKRALPKAEIDAYVYSEAIPMLEGHPALNRLIGYDRKWKKMGIFSRLRKEWQILREIRRGGYDLVISLTEGDRGAFAAKAAGAAIRVGFEPKGKWQKKIYTHVAKNCPGVRHTVERNLDAIRRIGIFPEERDLYLHVPEEAKRSVEQKVGLDPFIVIHPTSRWRFKCWPKEKMRQLAATLIQRGKKVVFTSGPDPAEMEMLAEIAQGLDVVNLGGRISLKELSALIEKAELLICVDSLPLHIASALKKPVVAIFGPTSDVAWGPWRNPQARVVSQNFSCRPCYQDGCGGSKISDCLFTLPVSQVLEAVDNVLEKKVLLTIC